MARYIDKDKLINELKEDCATLIKERWFDDYVQGYSSAIEDIIAEPEADVQEVKHAKWLAYRFGLEVVTCSNCGAVYEGGDSFIFCPKCGAKMDSEEKQ